MLNALVTGVSRRAGIGFAIAGRLEEAGAHVFTQGWTPHDAAQAWGADATVNPTLEADFAARQARHADLLAWTRSLIALRRSRLELSDGRRDRVQVTYDEDARWLVLRRGGIHVVCNLGAERVQVPVPGDALELLLESEPGSAFGPGRVELPGESVVVADLAR